MGVINKGFCERICIQDHIFEIVGSSARGCSDKINQDSFGYYADSHCLIIAIADGLGSAPFSEFGSKLVIDSVFKIMSEPNPKNIWERILELWKQSIDGEPKQYDTTCKFICIRDEKVTIGSIGDGWIGLLNTDCYCELENNNFFTNRTESICSPDLLKKACLLECDLQDIIAFGLSTDGFSEDLDHDTRGIFLHDACVTMSVNLSDMYSELDMALNNWLITTNRDDKTTILIKKVK